MKIIFLDFDGVIINRECFRAAWGGSGSHSRAHPDCIAALNRITDATDARIVISSTWRHCKNPNAELRGFLSEWGATGTVIGCTPILDTRERGIFLGHTRGEEIQRWLDSYSREPIEAFVILDDDHDMNGLSPKLVRTQFETGLTMADADKAIALLCERISEPHNLD